MSAPRWFTPEQVRHAFWREVGGRYDHPSLAVLAGAIDRLEGAPYSRNVHYVEIDEGDRQMLMMALADEAERCPGFLAYLETIADKFPGGLEMFRAFRAIRDEGRVSPADGGTHTDGGRHV